MASAVNFAFAFNNPAFSDRVLRLCIADPECKTEENLLGYDYSNSQSNERPSSLPTVSNEKSDSIDAVPRDGRNIDIYVNKVILAAHSEFFMKLFTNGMIESQTGAAVSVHISQEEELPMMELLQFMHTSQLRQTDVRDIGRLLPLVDRFRVLSCLEPCAKLLSRLPDNLDKCLILLGLPEAVKSEPAFNSVMSRCRTFIGELFRCPNERRPDFLALPLAAVRAVLGYDGLAVSREEEVLSYALDWASTNSLPSHDLGCAMEELAPAIRFPWMEGSTLVDTLAEATYMRGPICQDLLMEALKFKASPHWRQQELGKDTGHSQGHRRFRPRNHGILGQFLDGGVKTFVESTGPQLGPGVIGQGGVETDLVSIGGGCHVYFEFSLADVMCNGKTARSRPFSPDRGMHMFALEAVLSSVTRFSDRYTCSLNIYEEESLLQGNVGPPLAASLPAPRDPGMARGATVGGGGGAGSGLTAQSEPGASSLMDYHIGMKTSSLQEYSPRTTGTVVLSNCQPLGLRVTIQTLFDGWGSRGYPVGHLKPSWDAAFTNRIFIHAQFTTYNTS